MAENIEKEETGIDQGTYEIIKKRLSDTGSKLLDKVDQLNSARKEVFGSLETKVIGSDRIITENNCIARDMIAIGHNFIFGYNVKLGLKARMAVKDVFSTYSCVNDKLKKFDLEFMHDKNFIRDFSELYKYYKETVFSKFYESAPYIYFVFQVGKTARDIKTFKWEKTEDSLKYIDNRSDHEVKYPDSFDFVWKKTARDQYRLGKHPHISIDDRVFVETVGGDLTIKVEDNTESGQGIYEEAVDKADQSLGDAEIYYSIVENLILLKIKPYQEKEFRYFVFNEKIQKAIRLDSIKDSCLFLPDGHGLIYSDGYYLHSGVTKKFDTEYDNLIFEQKISSVNGEDFLYNFYQPQYGVYIMQLYNLIQQEVENPLICHGYSLFNDGRMIMFKADNEPRKNHVIQIWQTPFTENTPVSEAKESNILFKIGNKDIVKCMADCRIVLNLINREDAYDSLYIDLFKETTRIIDTYFWLDNKDAYSIKDELTAINKAAKTAIDEYDKVVNIKKNTAEQTSLCEVSCKKVLKDVKLTSYDNIDLFVNSLSDLRRVRGELVALKDLRYTDLSFIEKMEKEVREKSDQLSSDCIDFLDKPEGLEPYKIKANELESEVEKIKNSMDGKKLSEDIEKTAGNLNLLIEVVSNLKIEDPLKTTRIIDNISEIYAFVNRSRSRLKTILKDLGSREAALEFESQLKLVHQSIINYLELADSPDKCDELCNKLLIKLEELEGKFAEYVDLLPKVQEKREEVCSAFESKKIALNEKINKVTENLFQAGTRILSGVKNRLLKFKTIEEINSYLATDLMLEKLRDNIEKLIEYKATVKADDLQSRMKSLKEEAIRQLKDKAELFDGDSQVIKFGSFKFSVNTQSLSLSIIKRSDDLYFHLSGTDFYRKLSDKRIDQLREIWSMELISEHNDVYRSEFLAFKLFNKICNKDKDFTDDELNRKVKGYVNDHLSEGYIKGIHDADGFKILKELIRLHNELEMLTYASPERGLAQYYWINIIGHELKNRLISRLKSYSRTQKLFKHNRLPGNIVETVKAELEKLSIDLFEEADILKAAEYLCIQIMQGDRFAISAEAETLVNEFTSRLKSVSGENDFISSINEFNEDSLSKLYTACEWLGAFVSEKNSECENDLILEGALFLINRENLGFKKVSVKADAVINDMTGDHKLIESKSYNLKYHKFIAKLDSHINIRSEQFKLFRELKSELTNSLKEELKLDEFKALVLTSFVRNKLIDQVYLPLIGANLAKQIGEAGENKRTDLMGLLLLISPPGYGKTTLMEYIASRLGITFIKINGPAIGHEVTSFDPDQTKNFSAGQELYKLNLAFEMGNNVMIYCDDIQHCNPEFLQKFISLCDGQRKVEGIFNGRSKTYDLRGKKVAVVMAGNPYTESGQKFQIPDMLANRADIYNLGDMIRENEKAFKLSYLENCLTSNPLLNKVIANQPDDVYQFIKAVETGNNDNLDLKGSYTGEEIEDYLLVIRKLFKVRDVVLKVNQEYIHSAATEDEFRTEPPFKLQGSYRNMNKIAEKTMPVLTEKELDNIIIGAYENDAQTLSSGAEFSILRWKELCDYISAEEKQRLDDIRMTFRKNRAKSNADKADKIITHLEGMRNVLEQGIKVLK